MVALIEKMSRDGGVTREAVRKEKEAAKPKAGRPKHYTFSYKAANQGVQPPAAVHEVARRSRRSHRSAPGDHPELQNQ